MFITVYGPVVQLGERYNGIVEVRGSTPLRSTSFYIRKFLRGGAITEIGSRRGVEGSPR